MIVKREAGLFDDPFRRVDEGRATSPPPPAHRKLAREAAAKSVVLLKNEGNLLPLPRSGKRIALIGPFGEDKDNLDGPWSPFVPATPSVPLVDGLRAAMANPTDLLVAKGSDIDAPIDGGIERDCFGGTCGGRRPPRHWRSDRHVQRVGLAPRDRRASSPADPRRSGCRDR